MNRRNLLLLVALPLAGCASATMAVPPELSEVQPLPVEGRQGWFASDSAAFGGWRAVDVDRSWTQGGGWGVRVGPLGGGRDRARQEYAFRFHEDGVELGRVGCVATAARAQGMTTVVDVEFAGREGLECRPIAGEWAVAAADDDAIVDSVAGEPAWDLVVEASGNRHFEGFLRIGAERFALVSTGPGGRLTPATAYGYEIRDGDRVVASVETVNRGAVRLAPGLAGERRSIVAAAAAALLLHEPVRPSD